MVPRTPRLLLQLFPTMLALLDEDPSHLHISTCPFNYTGAVWGYFDSLTYLGKVDLSWARAGSVEIEATVVPVLRETNPLAGVELRRLDEFGFQERMTGAAPSEYLYGPKISKEASLCRMGKGESNSFKAKTLYGWLHLVAFQDTPEAQKMGWNQTGRLPPSLFQCDSNRSFVEDAQKVFPVYSEGRGDIIALNMPDFSGTVDVDSATGKVAYTRTDPLLNDKPHEETAEEVEREFLRIPWTFNKNYSNSEVTWTAPVHMFIDPPPGNSTWHLALIKCTNHEAVAEMEKFTEDPNMKKLACTWGFDFNVNTNCMPTLKPTLPPTTTPPIPIFDERLKISGPLQSGGLCLTFDSSEMTAYMDVCKGTPEQDWFFEQFALKSRAAPSSMCLDWTSDRDVYFKQCNGLQADDTAWRTQQDWYFADAALTTNKSSGWCLDWSPNTYHAAYMSDCRHGASKEWIHWNGSEEMLKIAREEMADVMTQDGAQQKSGKGLGLLTVGILVVLSICALLLVWRQCCMKARPLGWRGFVDIEKEMPMRTIGGGGDEDRSPVPQQVYSMLAD